MSARKPLLIAGVDEVGRGPLAGAVVTAAVILNQPIPGLTDSKLLTSTKRIELSNKILKEARAYAFGRAEVEEINELNIHYATLLAMQRAVKALTIFPDEVMVDGLFVPKLSIPCKAIVNGDKLIPEISAASIIAKVLRDAEMEALDKVYPGYGFASHKGYSTKEHKEALNRLGPCKLHRKNYRPVKEATAYNALSLLKEPISQEPTPQYPIL